jgi:hypothetical protein
MATQAIAGPKEGDWTKPAAMAIPKQGCFKLEQGRYGPILPKTPACYGFSVVGKVKPGGGGDSGLGQAFLQNRQQCITRSTLLDSRPT